MLGLFNSYFRGLTLRIVPLGSERQMDLWEKTKKIANEEGEEALQITISATYSLWRKMSTDIIKKLYQEHDQIRLQLNTDHSHFIIQNILDGSTDFGIVYNKPMSKEIAFVLIKKDTFSLYKHQGLTINHPMSFQYLYDETWIYLNWGTLFKRGLRRRMIRK